MFSSALLLLSLLQSAPATQAELRAEASGPLEFGAPHQPRDLGTDARLGFSSDESFALALSLRTQPAGFSTVLMCREGEAVNYGLVLGRRPGALAFEVWSWQQDKAIAPVRVDDGSWHEIAAAYDAPARTMGLWVDGRLQAVAEVRGAFRKSARPTLRLGNNLGTDQPFRGELKDVRVRAGVPEPLRADLATHAALRVLPAGAAAAAMERWLARMRAPRDPGGDPAAEARRIQAQVQDALGLWPPPYVPDAERKAPWPSPLHGRGDETWTPTDFARLRPTLPLDLREGGRLTRASHTVTRIDWRTFAGYRARGYLYQPTGPATGKRAAVLCPHGHWELGNRQPVVQARCVTLARLGYVVLTVDTEHVEDVPIGLSPAGVMTWNNLRGLEVLRSLPEVDPARIGCTGESGGGLQTMHLMSLDAGLAAAAPAVMACYFEEILRSEGVHCHCNFTPRLFTVGDQPQMCAAFAPRPALFLSVTGDWTHRFPTRGFPPLLELWTGLSAADRIGSRQWEGGHDFNRPMRNAVYAFFERWLHGASKPDPELEPADAETEPLATLAALDRDGAERDLVAVVREFRARLAAPPVAAGERLAVRREQLARLFGAGVGPVRVAERRPLSAAGRALEAARISDPRDPEIELPVLIARPTARATGWAILIGEGKSAQLLHHRAWIEALLQRGMAVLLADVRYTGELDQAGAWRDPYGRFFGADEGVLAVHDLQSLVAALPALDAEIPAHATVVAFGAHGAAALYAAALDARIERVIAPALGPTYAAADRAPRMARVLRHGDLPDAAALLAPRALWAGGVPDLGVYAGARACHGANADATLRLKSEPLGPEVLPPQ
jgi:hypothetical protein